MTHVTLATRGPVRFLPDVAVGGTSFLVSLDGRGLLPVRATGPRRWQEFPFLADRPGARRHHHGVSRGQPGLYFVGLSDQTGLASATLSGGGPDATEVVAALGARLGTRKQRGWAASCFGPCRGAEPAGCQKVSWAGTAEHPASPFFNSPSGTSVLKAWRAPRGVRPGARVTPWSSTARRTGR